MISFISGRVAARSVDSAVLEVGGVGMALHCTPATLARLRVGEDAHVPTSLVVREESLTLFGFADDDERDVFELLQTASGIGPKLALAMLAVHTPDALRRAVAADDITALTRVPGIGRKGAQRLVLELKDRLGVPLGEDPDGPGTGAEPGAAERDWRPQLRAALVNLGWSAKDAESAVAAVAPEAGPEPDLAVLLKSALRRLSRA
ncbi:Holliday junction branch migration protein RuvA [Allonocardiopsis opalescens]|uniref:Holliday junction branch migration complex subunit RuvA n=1 Tax=Allonocardiopsis opalescens TaxID=1144618 RepID=A0A2T0PWZ9_9ACTN|nr:Holliday junction branch migration protein RuvA [Allonocardiopsis opalescens]PRX96051.1 Holliday junction DNA helicase subunit RuvA [Allonocardiopsis opalescens]